MIALEAPEIGPEVNLPTDPMFDFEALTPIVWLPTNDLLPRSWHKRMLFENGHFD